MLTDIVAYSVDKYLLAVDNFLLFTAAKYYFVHCWQRLNYAVFDKYNFYTFIKFYISHS